MINDPQRFFQQLMAEVLLRSPRLAALLLNPDQEAAEKAAITLLADRIASLIENRGGTANTTLPADDGSAEDAITFQVLADRNQLLASALGACDCWGENNNCRVCGGHGRPGWTLPEREAFTCFVSPALRLMSQSRRGAS